MFPFSHPYCRGTRMILERVMVKGNGCSGDGGENIV